MSYKILWWIVLKAIDEWRKKRAVAAEWPASSVGGNHLERDNAFKSVNGSFEWKF